MKDSVTQIWDLTRTIIMMAESINEKLDETIGEFKKRDERIVVLRDMADQAKWNEEQMQKQINELKSSVDAFNGS
jgi:hypothetical protein